MRSVCAALFLLTWMLVSLPVCGADEKELPIVFEEKFADNPHSRFRMMPMTSDGSSSGNGAYDEKRHVYTMGGSLSLIRPVSAGAFVELNTTLKFEPAKADSPEKMQTDLMLVLMDKTMAGIEVVRSSKSDTPATLRFVQQGSGDARAKVLKEIPLPGSLDGAWLIRYRHGLLTAIHGDKTVGNVDLTRLGISVAGVSWTQKGGDVTCEKMVLRGEPARRLERDQQQSLQQASQLNMEARQLWNQKKTDEALAKMEEASAIYLKVHGDKHHDFGNSLTNLATILESSGKNEDAEKHWTKALAIHEAALGTTHPHTTLTRFNLGKNCMGRGDPAKAKELWTKCREDWKAIMGPDYPLVKSLDSILGKM